MHVNRKSHRWNIISSYQILSFVSISLHVTIDFSIVVLLRTDICFDAAIPHVVLSVTVD